MPITMRKIEWRGNQLRPVLMPSVMCPAVRMWGSDELRPTWMGIMHCNACAAARSLRVDYIEQTGEVGCSAP